MEVTNTKDPNYYHKIVDCQWACPAHTNVPEYIRMIAEGRYTDAYMLNRESNVFPGILGRVCDRPCEPACRRGRLEEKPVAICRLKRVAADFKSDIKDRLPKIPQKKNGKKVAIIGSGPAGLTTANDLMPLGYEVVMFEKDDRAGGAMRYQVPGFRLPSEVLDEEINNIVNMGVDLRLNTPVKSLKELLSKSAKEKFDAVYVATGAPVGRDLKIDGRTEGASNIQIGLEFLANVAFGHVTKMSGPTIIIGGGNTAMDCCRTALRLGSESVTVVAPEAYEQMLASEWEKEDAEHEGIKILNKLLPQNFVVEKGKLKGVAFQPLVRAYNDKKQWAPEFDSKPVEVIPATNVILAIGQNNAYPFIEADAGIKFEQNGKPTVDHKTFQSSMANVFFGGDAAFGPKNIIWAVAHGHDVAISIHNYCSSFPVTQRPAPGMNLISQKMGYHDWSYDQNFVDLKRQPVPHVDMKKRLSELKLEVELGFDKELALKEAQRCLNCDVQTVFTEKLCIECDACIDICPLNCLTMTDPKPEAELRQNLTVPADNLSQELFVSGPLTTGRAMIKDEDLCIHCGLCAERCPTAAWDMQKFQLNLPKAGASL